MRYLGIDYGSKRVGVALSDETKTIASPLVVIKNSKNLVSQIKDICREKEVEVVVVGESKDFAQKDNAIMKDIKIFVTQLIDETDLPVHFHPEFLTSKQAEDIQGKNEMHDASAAAIILQSYLDSNKNGK